MDEVGQCRLAGGVSMEMDENALAALQAKAVGALGRLPRLADELLVFRGRFVTLDFLIRIDDRSCFVAVEQGRIARVDDRPQKMRASTFTIGAQAADWDRFWQVTPAPGWHDIFAMNKRGHALIEGNLMPFMQNLQYFKDVLALPRQIWVEK
jgi:hypothetical protein